MWSRSSLPLQRVSNRSVQGRSPRGKQRLCFQDENKSKQVTLIFFLTVYLSTHSIPGAKAHPRGPMVKPKHCRHSTKGEGGQTALPSILHRGTVALETEQLCYGARTRSLERQETQVGLPTPLRPTSTSRGRNGFSASSGEVSTTTEPGYGNVSSFLNLVI